MKYSFEFQPLSREVNINLEVGSKVGSKVGQGEASSGSSGYDTEEAREEESAVDWPGPGRGSWQEEKVNQGRRVLRAASQPAPGTGGAGQQPGGARAGAECG